MTLDPTAAIHAFAWLIAALYALAAIDTADNQSARWRLVCGAVLVVASIVTSG